MGWCKEVSRDVMLYKASASQRFPQLPPSTASPSFRAVSWRRLSLVFSKHLFVHGFDGCRVYNSKLWTISPDPPARSFDAMYSVVFLHSRISVRLCIVGDNGDNDAHTSICTDDGVNDDLPTMASACAGRPLLRNQVGISDGFMMRVHLRMCKDSKPLTMCSPGRQTIRVCNKHSLPIP